MSDSPKCSIFALLMSNWVSMLGVALVTTAGCSWHSMADQKLTITQDCIRCYEPFAVDEASPEVLKTLGLEDRIASLQKP